MGKLHPRRPSRHKQLPTCGYLRAVSSGNRLEIPQYVTFEIELGYDAEDFWGTPPGHLKPLLQSLLTADD